MRPLQIADLEFLLERRAGPCVSLYLPTARAGREAAENPKRFKNLLRRAEQELGAPRSKPEPELDGSSEVLEPARALLDQDALWATPADGLAVFVGGGVFGWFRVPVTVPERVVVGERFHVAPLVSLFTSDGRFYLLTLSHHAVRLFEMTRTASREIDLGDTPRSLLEDRGPISDQDRLAGAETEKAELRHFLNRVDHGVLAHLEDRKPPLVLAGVEYVQGLYRDQSGYPNLVLAGLDGNFDHASGEELRTKALPLVEPLFARGLEHARARLERVAPVRVAHGAAAVTKAAIDGAVDSLFVTSEAPLWGHWDEDARRAQETSGEDPNAEDLADRAIAEVLSRGGEVFVVSPGQVPGGGAITALLRY